MTEESKYASYVSHMHLVKSRSTLNVTDTFTTPYYLYKLQDVIIYILAGLMDPDFSVILKHILAKNKPA